MLHPSAMKLARSISKNHMGRLDNMNQYDMMDAYSAYEDILFLKDLSDGLGFAVAEVMRAVDDVNKAIAKLKSLQNNIDLAVTM